MTIIFGNNATSTLAGAITNTALTANLSPGSGALFPTPGANQFFVLTFVDAATGLLNEIVHVTAISGDTITMVRGQEGTTALAWSAGDIAASFWTAGQAAAMSQATQSQVQATNYGVDSGAVNALAVTLSPVPVSLASLIGAPIRVQIGHTNTTTNPTLTINGFSPLTIVNPDGSALGVGQLPINGVGEFVTPDGVHAQVMSITNGSQTLLPQTGCQLQFVSTTQLLLAPKSGGFLWINGVNYSIPANLTIANTGLTANAALYVYAYINSGAMTLELSATGYTLNANGIPQKTADVTRTLVGFVKLQGSTPGQFQAQGVGTMSYFNRRSCTSYGTFGAISQGTTSYAEMDSAVRPPFVTWADEVVIANVTSEAGGSGTAGGSVAVYYDGGIGFPNNISAGFPGGIATGSSCTVANGVGNLAEGAHFLQAFAQTNSSTPALFSGTGFSATVRA